MKKKMRSYRNWIEYISKSNVNLIIRHDIDFDIKTVRKMMEIEKDNSLWSIIYVDIHSPSYTLEDIRSLYEDFHKDGFLFGIHINIAYDCSTGTECWQRYKEDIEILSKIIEIHSCTGHSYSSDVVRQPEHTNIDIEDKSNRELGYPPSFPQAFNIKPIIGRGVIRCADSAGRLVCIHEDDRLSSNIRKWLISLNDDTESVYYLAHPVYYYVSNNDVIFSKRFGLKNKIIEVNISKALEITDRTYNLTSYLSHSLKDLPHQVEARSCLHKMVKENYRKLYTIVDAACGIGLLGAYLLDFNNVKYIGVDINSKFIEAGKHFFNLLGYQPQLIVSDLYNSLPEGNVLVHLGYEDCDDVDYEKLYSIANNYNDVLITITGKDMYEEAKTRDKFYNFISEEDFENVFLKSFEIVKKVCIPKKRVFYWLRRS
jgi:hypothetical protein